MLWFHYSNLHLKNGHKTLVCIDFVALLLGLHKQFAYSPNYNSMQINQPVLFYLSEAAWIPDFLADQCIDIAVMTVKTLRLFSDVVLETSIWDVHKTGQIKRGDNGAFRCCREPHNHWHGAKTNVNNYYKNDIGYKKI